ncbi:MAG: PE family protein [Mycobacteriaceae bacterium]|nr:PE family protein [Mycobacteriaceae bacterium]
MFVTALPEAMDSAAAELASIGTTVVAGNAAGAAATTGVVPPAAEPASVLLAAAFGTHGGVYQVTQALGTMVHDMFVATMGASAGSYAASEAANVATMI